MWVWPSMKPGVTTWPSASISRAPRSRIRPIRAMRLADDPDVGPVRSRSPSRRPPCRCGSPRRTASCDTTPPWPDDSQDAPCSSPAPPAGSARRRAVSSRPRAPSWCASISTVPWPRQPRPGSLPTAVVPSGIECDVTDQDACGGGGRGRARRRAPRRARERGGRRRFAPTPDVTLDEWNRTLAVNLTGTFLMCQQVVARAGGVTRLHRERRVGCRRARGAVQRGLLRVEGRSRDAHEIARGRVRRTRCARELRVPELRRHAVPRRLRVHRRDGPVAVRARQLGARRRDGPVGRRRRRSRTSRPTPPR